MTLHYPDLICAVGDEGRLRQGVRYVSADEDEPTLAEPALAMLREVWKIHRNPKWLFSDRKQTSEAAVAEKGDRSRVPIGVQEGQLVPGWGFVSRPILFPLLQ